MANSLCLETPPNAECCEWQIGMHRHAGREWLHSRNESGECGQGIVFEISHADHFSVDEVGCQGLYTLKLLLLPILDRLRNLVGE